MRHSLGQDILNNMFLFFLIIIAELQELPPVCVASLMDVLYSNGELREQFFMIYSYFVLTMKYFNVYLFLVFIISILRKFTTTNHLNNLAFRYI